MGRRTASDAARRHSAQRNGPCVRQGGAGVDWRVGTGIHFVFAIAWGVLFAAIWPYFRRHGVEATLVALGYAVLAWIVMHVAIMIASDNHPNYYDPAVIIGGFMSHIFFTVPLALTVKRRFERQAQ